VHGISVERTQATNQAIKVPHAVSLVRNIEHALGFREPVPVEFERIERPVAVVRAKQDQLRRREIGQILVGSTIAIRLRPRSVATRPAGQMAI
jgi:hypothetical protein